MKHLTIPSTTRKEIIDLTERLQEELDEKGAGTGMLQLFITHTTAALTTMDLDPGTDQDHLDAFEAMIPKLRYRHPHDPSHVGDHIMSSIIGPALSVPYENGSLVLGKWQRIVLVELDGPRKRTIVMQLRAETS